MADVPFVSAIIVAAGNSTRMQTKTSKQFIIIDGKPVLIKTLEAFQKCELISEIIVVCRKCDISQIKALAESFNITKVKSIVSGGSTRQESVFNGVKKISDKTAYIAIHDGARPFITSELVESVIKEAIDFRCASLAVPVKDTIKYADENHIIEKTPDRNKLWAVQTPQVFERNIYLEAMTEAQNQNMDFTDDCQLIENIGSKVKLSIGNYSNIKITTIEDIPQGDQSMIKIGHGYDVHRLVEDRKLILGGVLVPHEKGLLGHSDADVLTHAIMDALLGAAGLSDIGTYFPDNDPAYSNADSLKLLGEVCTKIKNLGFSIVNIDCSLIAQKPKLKAYLFSMRENISVVCRINLDQINIKATTEEGLGFSGKELGISAHAVCLIKRDVQ